MYTTMYVARCTGPIHLGVALFPSDCTKPTVVFLFALIELFCYLLRLQSYEAKSVQLGCFRRGSTSLH